jgi:hypothetical protein
MMVDQSLDNPLGAEFACDQDSLQFPFPKRLPPGHFEVARVEWRQGRAFLWIMDPAAWEYGETARFKPYCSVRIDRSDDKKGSALKCLRFGWSWELKNWETDRPHQISGGGPVSEDEVEQIAGLVWAPGSSGPGRHTQ